MKQKLNRFARVFIPFFLAVFIVVFSASPAFAVSMSIPAGIYAFVEQMDTPDQAFLANISFVCNDIAYKGIIYKPPDLEASFRYGAIYYIRADNGAEERVCYWISDETYWIGYFYRVIAVQSTYTVENSNFYAWFIVNAGVASEPEKVDPWGDITSDQIQDLEDKVNQNQDDIGSIEDAYGKLPLPNVNPDDYSISLWLETEYQAFVSCLAVFWENSLVMNIVAILGALLLVSFLVFGSK